VEMRSPKVKTRSPMKGMRSRLLKPRLALFKLPLEELKLRLEVLRTRFADLKPRLDMVRASFAHLRPLSIMFRPLLGVGLKRVRLKEPHPTFRTASIRSRRALLDHERHHHRAGLTSSEERAAGSEQDEPQSVRRPEFTTEDTEITESELFRPSVRSVVNHLHPDCCSPCAKSTGNVNH